MGFIGLPRLLAAAACFSMVAGALGGGAFAEPMPDAVIAVIDYQRIERESVAAQAIMEQVDQYRAAYQVDITNQENALRVEREELERQQTILSAESFNERRRAFEAKFQELQRQVMDRTRILDRALASARDEILQTVLIITRDISEDRGFNIVLEKTQSFFYSNALNITDAVLAELDQRLPEVSASVPKPE